MTRTVTLRSKGSVAFLCLSASFACVPVGREREPKANKENHCANNCEHFRIDHWAGAAFGLLLCLRGSVISKPFRFVQNLAALFDQPMALLKKLFCSGKVGFKFLHELSRLSKSLR